MSGYFSVLRFIREGGIFGFGRVMRSDWFVFYCDSVVFYSLESRIIFENFVIVMKYIYIFLRILIFFFIKLRLEIDVFSNFYFVGL